MKAPAHAPSDSALERLVRREDVLEICYWYHGEGFGDVYDSAVLAPFLQRDAAAIDAALCELAARGLLERLAGDAPRYCLTAAGEREGGKLFADTFADLQRQGHGECVDGCCEEDDHSRCGAECTHARVS